MLEDLNRVVSKFFKLTNRLIRTRERERNTRALYSKSSKNSKGERASWSQTVFRFQNQKSVTTKLERLSVERWCLNLKARGET